MKIKVYQEKTEFFSQILAVMTAFFLPLSTTLTGVFFVFTVATNLAAGNWRDKFAMILHNRIAVGFLIFFALFVVGLSYTQAPFADALYILSKYDKLLFAALLMPIFREEKIRNYALNAFILAVVIALLCSYLKAFGVIKYGAWYGPVEIFKGHISFSFLMGITAYLAALNFTEVKNIFYKIVLVVLVILIIYEILFLGTGRSGYFVLFGLVVLFCVQKSGWRGLIVGCVSVAILVSISWILPGRFKEKMHDFHSDVVTYQVDPQTSVGARMAFVEHSFSLIRAHPFFGSGTGSFKSQYNNLSGVDKVRTTNPHDEYIHIAVQFGAVGIIILLSLFGMQLWYSRFLPQQMGWIAQAVVIAIIIGCFANSWLLDTTPGHVYVFFMALTFASLKNGKTLFSKSSDIPHMGNVG